MERTAKDGHGVSENKAPEHQSFNTIKTAKPKVLENVTFDRSDAEEAPSDLSATLHGSDFAENRTSATLHGSDCGEPNACVHNVFAMLGAQNLMYIRFMRLFCP